MTPDRVERVARAIADSQNVSADGATRTDVYFEVQPWHRNAARAALAADDSPDLAADLELLRAEVKRLEQGATQMSPDNMTRFLETSGQLDATSADLAKTRADLERERRELAALEDRIADLELDVTKLQRNKLDPLLEAVRLVTDGISHDVAELADEPDYAGFYAFVCGTLGDMRRLIAAYDKAREGRG